MLQNVTRIPIPIRVNRRHPQINAAARKLSYVLRRLFEEIRHIQFTV